MKIRRTTPTPPPEKKTEAVTTVDTAPTLVDAAGPITLENFLLFDIEPTFKINLGESPGKPQVCSKGHRWNYGFNFVGIRLDVSSLGLTEGIEDYCFLCLRDLLRQHVGRVKTA